MQMSKLHDTLTENVLTNVNINKYIGTFEILWFLQHLEVDHPKSTVL